jgi:hypothetical protein
MSKSVELNWIHTKNCAIFKRRKRIISCSQFQKTQPQTLFNQKKKKNTLLKTKSAKDNQNKAIITVSAPKQRH